MKTGKIVTTVATIATTGDRKMKMNKGSTKTLHNYISIGTFSESM